MDEHIEILSSFCLDLTLHLLHLLPHLFQFFFQFGSPGIRSGSRGLCHLTRTGYPILIGGASFIILILILVSPLLVAKAFYTVLTRNRNLNFSPRRRRAMSSWFCLVNSCISLRSTALCHASSWMLAVRAYICLSEVFKCWPLVSPTSMEREAIRTNHS